MGSIVVECHEVGDLDRRGCSPGAGRRARRGRRSRSGPSRSRSPSSMSSASTALPVFSETFWYAGSGRRSLARAGGSARVVAHRGVRLHGHVDQPEADRAAPDGAGHRSSSGSSCSSPTRGRSGSPTSARRSSTVRIGPAVGAQVGVVELVPGDRHRHRCAGRGPGAERRDQRLVDGVLRVVEPGQAVAVALVPLPAHELGHRVADGP